MEEKEEREPLISQRSLRSQRSGQTGPTPREDQPCFSIGKVTSLADQQATKGWNLLVDARQLQDYPAGTLVCARCTKMLLWIAVIGATFTLLFEYFLGEFGVETEIIKFGAFAVPNIVLCPVWGQKNLKITIESASLGDYVVEDPEKFKPIEYNEGPCAKMHEHFDFEYVKVWNEKVTTAPMKNADIEALGCHCVSFGDGDLELHEQKVGREGVRLKFAANFAQDAKAHLVSIGFSHGDVYPTDWAYLETGKRNVAELYQESRAYAKTVLWPGTPVDKFNLVTKAAFAVPDEVQPSPVSEIIFYPGSFFIREISDVASIWSAFALTSLIMIVLAGLNSVQLFDIIFPEKVDAEDPAQIQPSWLCRKLCGCLWCCQPLPPPPPDDDASATSAP